MLFRTVVAALVAGIVAGAASFLAQRWTTVPLIHEAELHEPGSAGEHHAGEPPEDATTRATYTLVGDILLAIGFGLMLCGAYLLTGRSGVPRGLRWGLAGFAIFHLSPALVVPPLLPGFEPGSLATRQALWLAATLATASGLGLLIFGGRPTKIVGALLIAMPLVVAEMLPGTGAQSSPSIAIEPSFIVWSLVAALVMWLLLGGITGAVSGALGPDDHD